MPDPLNPPSAAPELLKVMFGQAASLVVSTSPRLDRWSAAFTAWLESIAAARGRAAYLQSLNSWEQLLRFHRCPPWELDRSKLEVWTAHLAESGLSANTIRCYQGRISAFFRFYSRRPEFLSTEPQFDSSTRSSNPLHAVPRPKVENYRTAYVLRPAEARLLLRAVDRQSSLVGKRDYAILLTLLLTGLTEAELRHLRWSQNEWLVERGFHRLKGTPLSLSPLFVQRDDQVAGLTNLLSLAVRFLTLIEFVVRRNLKRNQEKLTGLIENNPKKGIDNPTTKRLLKQFDNIFLTIVHLPDQVIRHVTPLTDLHVRILELLGLSVDCYARLADN